MKDYVYRMYSALQNAGVDYSDAVSLRRISMTLNNWFELECGTDAGHIERDEKTEKPFFISYNQYTGKQYRRAIPDRERGAMICLNSIMTKYPQLSAYVQGDPRGAALYIIRPGDIPEGKKVDAYYSNGIALYK